MVHSGPWHAAGQLPAQVRKVLPNYSGQIDHKKRCRIFIQAASIKRQA